MRSRKKDNYHEFSLVQLVTKKKELEESILKLKVQAAGTVVKNYRALRMGRRDLARVLTIMSQKKKLEKSSGGEG
jgi:ribosomal protein L29